MGADSSRSGVLLAWAAILAACISLIAARLEFAYDLALFLPAPADMAQDVLVQRAGDAPGSRFLIVVLPDGVNADATLLERLAADPAVSRVLDGTASIDPAGIPEPAWTYRYLLTDTDWSTPGLRAALEQRLAELGLGADSGYETLLRRDPTLQSTAYLESLAPGEGAAWRTAGGRRMLVVETAAPAFELDGQAAAIEHVRNVIADAGVSPVDVELSGAGVFGAELRNTIHSEAMWRSVAASVALALVLLLAYRRWAALWQAGIPLLTGLLVGLAAVTAVFGQVHGITLAFGFTLLGVAIDYPLHVLSHARRSGGSALAGAVARVWPTLRLGAASTILAYGALVLGGARGIAQLGLFSAVGVAAAALATRRVLPVVGAGSRTDAPAAMPVDLSTPGLRLTPAFVALAIGVGALLLPGHEAFWNRDLSALSPLPAERLARDAELRSTLGAPSMRFQIALRDPDIERLRERAGELHETLEAAVHDGLLDGFRDLSGVLPPARVQLERRAAIPEPRELRSRLAAALEGLPFATTAFDGFLEDAANARTRPPLGPGEFEHGELEDVLSRFLFRSETGPGDETWTALVELPGDVDVAGLGARLSETVPNAVLVDYRAASEALVADYQARTWRVMAVVLLAIGVLLLWRIRPRRAAWSVASVLAGLLMTAALLRLLVGPLNLYHMMGLLLVAGLGLDYALFLGRTDDHRLDTRHAVVTCVLSTGVVFGILGASGIPALRALGSSVALGAVICFVIARLGATGHAGSTPAHRDQD